MVAFIPAKFRVYREFCRFAPDSPCLTWQLDGLAQALEATVSQVSPEIGYLDLTTKFRAETAKGSLLYLADDTHWSPEGHLAAANAIADYLAISTALCVGPRPPRSRGGRAPAPPAPGLVPRTKNPVYELKKRPPPSAARSPSDQRSASSRPTTPASAGRPAVAKRRSSRAGQRPPTRGAPWTEQMTRKKSEKVRESRKLQPVIKSRSLASLLDVKVNSD